MGKKLTTAEFIIRAKEKHGNAYDYSQVEYKNTDTPVSILCPLHGVFLQTPHNHLHGKGCKYCKYGVFNTEDFITKAIKIHGNKYNYTSVNYTTTNTPVVITCPTHGDFIQTPAMHLSGRGCRRCASITCTEDFIAKSKEIHSDKYIYESSIFTKFDVPIEVTCRLHGPFFVIPRYHITKKYGCPSCAASGFKYDKPGILYYLSVNNGTAYKIGITNNSVEQRFHKADLNKIRILHTWYFESGKECFEKEQDILKTHTNNKYNGEPLLSTGNSELFNVDVLQLDTNVFTK